MNNLSRVTHLLTVKMALEPRKRLARALFVLLVETHLRPAYAKKEVSLLIYLGSPGLAAGMGEIL